MLSPWGISLAVLYVLRKRPVPGTHFSLSVQSIPGILGMNVVFTGLLGVAIALTMDREDGTLLRAKATPNGMLGYLIGRVTSRAAMTIAGLLIILIPAAFLFHGLHLRDFLSWLKLAGILLLGLMATLPIGAILGALFSNAQSIGIISLPMMGLVAISGIFYPITALPGWLQRAAQEFPVYWLGLGMRSVLLPNAMSAAEIGGSWRQPEMIFVLGGWAVIGFLLAPAVLRRMARRESGSSVARRREKARRRQA